MRIKETLTRSDYAFSEKVQSKIDPEKTLRVEAGLYCPRCKEKIESLDHGQSEICSNCHLKMTSWGNALECEATND